MNECFKLIIGIISRSILKILYPFFRVQSNRILFSSYNGTQYSCNPKYISEYLMKNYKNEFEVIWSFNDTEKFKKLKNKNIKIVKNKSLKWIYYTMTSKFGITNTGVNSFVPLRSSQYYINTWHGGGCYKKVESADGRKNKFYISKIKTVANMTRIFLSSSQFFSKVVIRDSFLYNGEILDVGMPRNDILFKKDKDISNNIREKLGILKDSYIVLYAPTWREMNEEIDASLDIEKLKKTIEKKFNISCTLLYRAHHFSTKTSYTDIVDVSEYDDMQELMCIADMLITDFSSCMWDFSFTYKPCFLFIPDLKEYTEKVGFDRDINEWGFPICLTNQELSEKILDFDYDKFKLNMKKHHDDLKSYEIGEASKLICKKIKKIKEY